MGAVTATWWMMLAEQLLSVGLSNVCGTDFFMGTTCESGMPVCVRYCVKCLGTCCGNKRVKVLAFM